MVRALDYSCLAEGVNKQKLENEIHAYTTDIDNQTAQVGTLAARLINVQSGYFISDDCDVEARTIGSIFVGMVVFATPALVVITTLFMAGCAINLPAILVVSFVLTLFSGVVGGPLFIGILDFGRYVIDSHRSHGLKNEKAALDQMQQKKALYEIAHRELFSSDKKESPTTRSSESLGHSRPLEILDLSHLPPGADKREYDNGICKRVRQVGVPGLTVEELNAYRIMVSNEQKAKTNQIVEKANKEDFENNIYERVEEVGVSQLTEGEFNAFKTMTMDKQKTKTDKLAHHVQMYAQECAITSCVISIVAVCVVPIVAVIAIMVSAGLGFTVVSVLGGLLAVLGVATITFVIGSIISSILGANALYRSGELRDEKAILDQMQQKFDLNSKGIA